jgi:hypothetical protein
VPAEAVVSRKAMTDCQVNAIYQTLLRDKALVSGDLGSVATAMTHVAVQEKLSGKVVEWMEQVRDERYKKFRPDLP